MRVQLFFISWICSSVIMFSLSYFWHGVFLNDFQRLNYPKELFLTGSVITYMILGFIIAKIYSLDFTKKINRQPILKGVLVGMILGVITYLVSRVTGISFNSEVKLEYMLVDALWQVIEQTIGGIAVGLVYVILYHGDPQEIVSKNMFRN